MRAEVKAGLIVGLVAIAVGGIWWFSRPTNELAELQIDKATMDAAAARDTALASDTVPTVRESGADDRSSPESADSRWATGAPERHTTPVQPASEQPEAAFEGLGEGLPLARDSEPTVAPPGPEPGDTEIDKAGVTRVETDEFAGVGDSPTPDVSAPRRRQPIEIATTEHPRAAFGQPRRQTYTIQPGDRLIDLARDEYGDGDLWEAIKAANPGIDENRLQIGEEIQIPSHAEALRMTWPATDQAPPARPGLRPAPGGVEAGRATYVVGHGDTLIAIARNVLDDESRWEEIYELNRDQLESADLLHVGMELLLPPLDNNTSEKADED